MKITMEVLAVTACMTMFTGGPHRIALAQNGQPQCYGSVENSSNRVRLEEGTVTLVTQWEIQVRGLRDDVEPGEYLVDFYYNVHYEWETQGLSFPPSDIFPDGKELLPPNSGENSRDSRFFHLVDAPGSHQFVEERFELVMGARGDVISASIVNVEFGDGYVGGVSCRRAGQ